MQDQALQQLPQHHANTAKVRLDEDLGGVVEFGYWYPLSEDQDAPQPATTVAMSAAALIELHHALAAELYAELPRNRLQLVGPWAEQLADGIEHAIRTLEHEPHDEAHLDGLLHNLRTDLAKYRRAHPAKPKRQKKTSGEKPTKTGRLSAS